MADTSTKERLVTANRALANEGVIQTFGHVSAREPGANEFFISRSISPACVTEEDILKVTSEGEVIDGDGMSTYKETEIHRSIYAERDDVNAVIHHHDDAIMPYTIPGVDLRPSVRNDAVIFPDPIPTFEDYDREFGRLIVSREEGERMAGNLGDGRAQFLERHGANVVGSGVKEAIFVALRLNMEARIQFQTDILGGLSFATDPTGDLKSEGSIILSSASIDRMWDYLRFKLDDG